MSPSVCDPSSPSELASCPVCASGQLVPILERSRLPAMQNVTYASRNLALASPCVSFRLAACASCGFLFNSRFDPDLAVYDGEYDNHVESEVFDRYYRRISQMLIERFDLDAGGLVYDVGCGRGTFLKVLCQMAPNVRGVGIDPSCEPYESDNVTLIRGMFSQDAISRDAKVVLLRHVLEHMPRPVEFLSDLGAVIHNATLFVEVPETTWIFDSGAFWDFCYEHCNYFTPATLGSILDRTGFDVVDQAVSFEGQYQWAVARRGKGQGLTRLPASIEAAQDYGRREASHLDRARQSLSEAAQQHACVLWGMATKGVVFASLFNEGLIAGGVDSNPRKQGRYAPGSGVGIHAPEWLAQFDGKVTAFVMNRNYLDEIRAQTAARGIAVDFRTA